MKVSTFVRFEDVGSLVLSSETILSRFVYLTNQALASIKDIYFKDSKTKQEYGWYWGLDNDKLDFFFLLLAAWSQDS
jgi:hypothetical protein